MVSAKQKYYYAIIYKPTNKLLVTNGQLPVYWNKKVAKEISNRFDGSQVIRVTSSDLHEALNLTQ